MGINIIQLFDIPFFDHLVIPEQVQLLIKKPSCLRLTFLTSDLLVVSSKSQLKNYFHLLTFLTAQKKRLRTYHSGDSSVSHSCAS